jgi:phytoene synthase
VTADPLRASYDYCASLSRREARNFYYSFLVLPPARRRAMCALYAFMRHTDDLADQQGDAPAKRAAIEAWRGALETALDGGPQSWPGLAALADTVRRYDLPRHYLREVIDGVAMDVEPRPFTTFDELYRYCYHVASAVGLSCIHIWGFRSEGGRAEKLAESCGVALQLTNILRDIREDALAGRVYLPREDLDRFGVSPAELSSRRLGVGLRRLFAFEAQRAYDFYAQSEPLVRLIEPVGRPVLRAIVGIYRSLLDEIARRDYNVLAGRVALPAWRKTAITLRALVG